MNAVRLTVDVPEDRRVTVQLPEGTPVGRTEVILVLDDVVLPGANGRRLVEALKALPNLVPGAWVGAQEELRAMRDEWDDE
jgi:hypothetical protein